MASPLSNALFVCLADIAVYSQVAQGYHWNCTGPLFFSYHGLFGKIYDESSAQLDRVAELCRSLGTPVPATLTAFVGLSGIQEGPTNIPVAEQVATLLAHTDTCLAGQAAALAAASGSTDPGAGAAANVLGDLLELFGKFKYLLSSCS